MARKRTFVTKRRNLEPLEFTIEYQELVTEELPDDAPEGSVARTFASDRSETFTAIAVAPGGVLLEFTEKVEPETGARPASAIIQFLEDVLVDGDAPRFTALIHSKTSQVDIDTLGEVVSWLMEEYGQRPTSPSNGSGGGGTTGGAGSTDAVPSLD